MLSRVSKLDSIRSWSLQAGDTCPGSFTPLGELVDACHSCYAKLGNYHLPSVKNVRAVNHAEWQLDDWVDNMVLQLEQDLYFRWFDSGDMYKLRLARKILEIMRRTPWCRHWLPTRMAKFEPFKELVEQMRALPNVVVRFSSDSVIGEYTPGVHGSTIVPRGWEPPEGVQLCNAPANKGKCNGCRACWDPEVAVIGYVGHGNRIPKRIRIALAREAA